jgi:hypothetical protein
MIINGIHESQNLLSLWLVSFLVGLKTYQHPCTVLRMLLNEIYVKLYNNEMMSLAVYRSMYVCIYIYIYIYTSIHNKFYNIK